MRKRLQTGKDLAALLALHELKIRWLSHERLIHLLVTLFTALLFLSSAVLLYFTGGLAAFAFSAITCVLTVFYIHHYFTLENAVQRWYVLYDDVYRRLSGDPADMPGESIAKEK